MMSCVTASTPHARGEANSVFSSLAAIVKIIRSTHFAPREIDEYAFQAALVGTQLEQAPIARHCLLDEHFSRILILDKPNAEQRWLNVFRHGDARHCGNFRERRRPPQSHEHRVAAMDLPERDNRIAIDDAAMVHDLDAVAYRLDFREDVGRQNHAVRAGKLPAQLPDFPYLIRIGP